MKYHDNPEVITGYLFGLPLLCGLLVGIAGLIIDEFYNTYDCSRLYWVGLSVLGAFIGGECLGWFFLLKRKRRILGEQHNHPAVQEYFARKGGKNE